MSLQPIFITGISQGLMENKKPFLLPDQAWSKLENAYCWRERVIKREGLKLLGRLSREVIDGNLGMTAAGSTFTIANIFATLSIPESHAEIALGTLKITVSAPDTSTFMDTSDGNFMVTGKGQAAGSYINYDTGKLVLHFNPALAGGATVTASFIYYPSLPTMGIASRDLTAFNQQQTIWWDQTYAYVWNGSGFNEFITGTTWASTNSDFFWWFNYRGLADNQKLLFESNFINDAADPMRYTDGATWTTFQPVYSGTGATQRVVFTAKIIVAYYGALLLLNTYEGLLSDGNAGAVNFFNRVRWNNFNSSPIGVNDNWRTDIITGAGFLDAPTNEAIIKASFVRNTLIVKFEQSTWQLRFLGAYGAPFIWERVSSDFGSESTFSGVLFDNHELDVGDVGITASTSNAVERIDLDIPDEVFGFKNSNNGTERVFGIRNFQKEVVYWNYVDSTVGTGTIFPNYVLLYNYRNGTWAKFRDNVTAFGNFQLSSYVTWDSTTVTWDSDTVTWDDVQSQSFFPAITSGNQQGFISLYMEDSGFYSSSPIQEEPSLSITGVDLTLTPIQITVNNHNLITGETVYITGLLFLDPATFTPLTTSLNANFYQVQVIDANTLALYLWNFSLHQYVNDFTFTPIKTAVYVGGGLITLVPKLNVISKDINIYQQKSLQTKLSRVDFLLAPSSESAVTINLITDARGAPNPTLPDNIYTPVWSTNLSTVLTTPYYPQGMDYAWFRYYATLAAQYFKINMTYDDNLMNTLSTHFDPFTIYAINAWTRPGGKNVF